MSTCPKDITLEENLTIFLVITWICHSRNLEYSYLEKRNCLDLLTGLGSRLHWKPTVLSWKLLQKLE